jgi:hypothetical protein
MCSRKVIVYFVWVAAVIIDLFQAVGNNVYAAYSSVERQHHDEAQHHAMHRHDLVMSSEHFPWTDLRQQIMLLQKDSSGNIIACPSGQILNTGNKECQRCPAVSVRSVHTQHVTYTCICENM